MMHHPNVAAALDAGATDKGRPYFVMEFVRGLPVTEYCDARKMSVRHRLRLFLQACEGVQHAHQKGIIHRDIKPSNVIVGESDSRPLLKIIDFGVAKSTQGQLTGDTLHTQIGSFIGTPNYSSPEQAQSDTMDIDTRADVYSLGVLLFELLIGRLPFDPGTFNDKTPSEIQHILRDVEPPSPSEKMAALRPERERLFAERGVNFDDLERDLRSDLGWIIQRAMEKNRNDRYPSASALAADLRRFLDDLPVEARPHPATYRARKFVRRHRWAVIATLTGVLLALAGLLVTTVLYLRAVEAEAEARRSAGKANALNEFLLGIFENADPEVTGGKEINARDLIAIAERQLEHTEIDSFHEIQMLGVMGRVYRIVGDHEAARRMLDRAMERSAGNDEGAPAEEQIQLLNDYALLHLAENDLDQALDAVTRADVLAVEHFGEDADQRVRSGVILARVLNDLGRYDEALEAARFANRLALSIGDVDLELIADTHNQLGLIHDQRDEFERAEAQYRLTLDLQNDGLDPLNPVVLLALNNLGLVYISNGRFGDAQVMHEQSLERRIQVYGPTHPKVAVTLNNLARVFEADGRFDEAAERYLQSIEIRREYFGADHSRLAAPLFNLGVTRARQGQYELAIVHMREAHELNLPDYGYLHPRTVLVKIQLARTELMAGRPEQAEAEAREALSVIEQLRSARDAWRNDAAEALAGALYLQGRHQEVLAMLAGRQDASPGLIAVLADSLLLTGSTEQAAALAEAPRDDDSDADRLPWREDLKAGIALSQGRLDQARELLDRTGADIDSAVVAGDPEVALIKAISERRRERLRTATD